MTYLCPVCALFGFCLCPFWRPVCVLFELCLCPIDATSGSCLYFVCICPRYLSVYLCPICVPFVSSLCPFWALSVYWVPRFRFCLYPACILCVSFLDKCPCPVCVLSLSYFCPACILSVFSRHVFVLFVSYLYSLCVLSRQLSVTCLCPVCALFGFWDSFLGVFPYSLSVFYIISVWNLCPDYVLSVSPSASPVSFVFFISVCNSANIFNKNK